VTGAPPAPPVDDKDWTWVLERPCPDCGFDAAAVAEGDVATLVAAEAAPWADVLQRPDARERPVPTTWSPLEYAAHVRDVLQRCRARTALMLEQDDPVFEDWDQDATALEEGYHRQDPAVVAAQLAASADDVVRLYEGVAGAQWSRPGRRSNGSRFTVASFARYVLHDLAHHRHDVGA
jgi:hypothetical protein